MFVLAVTSLQMDDGLVVETQWNKLSLRCFSFFVVASVGPTKKITRVFIERPGGKNSSKLCLQCCPLVDVRVLFC